MTVTDGYCQRISGIVGGRNFGESEQEADHRLHLMLFGSTIADDCALDLQRRILENGDAALRRSQQGDPTGMPQLERRLDIGGVENLLDCQHICLRLSENLAKARVDGKESFGECLAWLGLDSTVQHGGVS